MTASGPTHTAVQPIAAVNALRPWRALLLPLGFSLVLFGFGWLPAGQQNSTLQASFWGAAVALATAAALLLTFSSLRGRTLKLEVVLRSQHYVQACAQLSVYLYWGWYWREVYHSLELFVAQLLFAYAFDALLTWARRDTYVLGFGPFPIIFSTNLFLWFKADWFYFQFALVALGFAAKELIRWNKDGRRVHIFNPSSLPLAVCSLILLATGTTDRTWGPEIAITQLFPPYIYVLIFVAALPVQYLFGVTLMTMSAAVASFAFSAGYVALTGVEWYGQTYIPIASFLGMHLLFTDPSTSPRTDLGRILFGTIYGLSIAALYGLLERYGQPQFYDKLLVVPILNLLIQAIDRFASSRLLQRIDPTAWLSELSPRRRHLVHIALWACAFVVMQEISRDDRNWVRHRKLGVMRFNEGKLDEAVEHFRALTRIDPDDPDGLANVGLAMSLQARGRPDEAAEHFRVAVRGNPDLWTAQLELGKHHRRKGDHQVAIEHFERALAVQPDDWLLHTEMGLARAAMRDAQAARRHFQRASELQPGPDLQRNLGMALLALGDLDAAVERFRHALEFEPGHSQSRMNLAEALAAQGNLQAAADQVRELLALDPDHAGAHALRAQLLFRLDRPVAAAEHLERVIALQPADVTSMSQLAWLYATSSGADVRDGERALALARQLREMLRQPEPGLLDILAAAHAELGDYPRAVRVLTEALPQLPSLPPSKRQAIRQRLQLYQEDKPYRATDSGIE